jgi:hypothetical protein
VKWAKMQLIPLQYIIFQLLYFDGATGLKVLFKKDGKSESFNPGY